MTQRRHLLGRVRHFVRERFPLGPSLLGAALLALVADRVGGRLVGRVVDGAFVDAVGVAATLFVLALFFIVRVVDELGDLDEDRLAWPDRPLPSGATAPADVVGLAVVVGAIAVIAVAVAAGAVAAAVSVVVIAATVALQRDLGSARLRRHPLLSLGLHQLMVPMWALAIVSFRDVDVLLLPARWPWPTVVLALCLSLLFELGRKTRHPADEVHGDESWSQVFGLRGSVGAIVVVAIAAALLTVVIVHTLQLSVWAMALPVVSLVWVIGVAVRVPHRRGRLLELSTALASLWVYLPLLLAAT